MGLSITPRTTGAAHSTASLTNCYDEWHLPFQRFRDCQRSAKCMYLARFTHRALQSFLSMRKQYRGSRRVKLLSTLTCISLVAKTQSALVEFAGESERSVQITRAAGVIAKVDDHAGETNLVQHYCIELNGIAATAFKDPVHDVTAPKRTGWTPHSPESTNSESVRELASPAVSRRKLPSAPLRRLSRPLLARESYNGGEAKCGCSVSTTRLGLT